MAELDTKPKFKESFKDEYLVTFAVMVTLVLVVNIFTLFLSMCMMPDLTAALRSNDVVAMTTLHKKIKTFVDIAWITSAWFGTALFLIDIAAHAWVKFAPFDDSYSALISNIIIGVTLVLMLIFGIMFNFRLSQHKVGRLTEKSSNTLQEAHSIAELLNEHSYEAQDV